MADRGRSPALLSPSTAYRLAILRQFVAIGKGYWSGDDRWAARLNSIGLAVLTVAQVLLAIRLNLWSADLFDALERRQGTEVAAQVGIFVGIVAGTIVTNVAHIECKRRLQLGWRRWLTKRMVDRWMASGRQHLLVLMPGDHSNPDARIAEDVRLVTEYAFDLGHSLLYCLLLIVSFVGILWFLSGTIEVPLGFAALEIEGHYVWLAIVYAGLGSILAIILGRPLVRATDSRQTKEADYRFELVRGREHGEAIALLAGEGEERRRLDTLFAGIALAWREQTSGLRTLTAFTSAYSTLALMLPFLVAAPRFLSGAISLGGLMQIAQAFQQLTGALSWPVDNSQRLAEMFASIDRVLTLEAGLRDVSDQHQPGRPGTIEVAPMGDRTLAIRDLSIAHPDGRALFTGIDAEIRPGERVLILGDPQLTRTLYKALAGVWPWGTGRIELPVGASVMFVPHRPYLPADTLRHVLSYPDEPDTYADDRFRGVLDRTGLGHLAVRLEERLDWDHVLDPAEQERIAFARVLLKRPSWIFLEEPSDVLGRDVAEALLLMIMQDLPSATLVTISGRADLETLYRRTVRLSPAAPHRIFTPPARPEPPPRVRGNWRGLAGVGRRLRPRRRRDDHP